MPKGGMSLVPFNAPRCRACAYLGDEGWLSGRFWSLLQFAAAFFSQVEDEIRLQAAAVNILALICKGRASCNS